MSVRGREIPYRTREGFRVAHGVRAVTRVTRQHKTGPPPSAEDDNTVVLDAKRRGPVFHLPGQKKRPASSAERLSLPEPQVGIEPTTARLRIECSTPELLWRVVRLSSLACPGTDSNRYALRHHPLKICVYHFHHQGNQPVVARVPTSFQPSPSNRNTRTRNPQTVSCPHGTKLKPATSE